MYRGNVQRECTEGMYRGNVQRECTEGMYKVVCIKTDYTYKLSWY